jgi:hypothetical protein
MPLSVKLQVLMLETKEQMLIVINLEMVKTAVAMKHV